MQTITKLISTVCKAAQRSLFWTPNWLNELPEVRFEFPFNLISYYQSCAAHTSQVDRLQKLFREVLQLSLAFQWMIKLVFCFRRVINHNERYLVHGKVKFSLYPELLLCLPFSIKITTSFICKEWASKLKKRTNLISQLEILDCSLEKLYFGNGMDPKRPASDDNEAFLTVTKNCIA